MKPPSKLPSSGKGGEEDLTSLREGSLRSKKKTTDLRRYNSLFLSLRERRNWCLQGNISSSFSRKRKEGACGGRRKEKKTA